MKDATKHRQNIMTETSTVLPRSQENAEKIHMLIRSFLIAAGFLTLSTTGEAADQIGYSSSARGALFTVDLTKGSFIDLIGGPGIDLLEGLAFSPGGTLFGTDDRGNLYSINKTTAATSLIGNTGLGDIEGLDFNGSTLLGTNFGNSPTTVYSINTTTAAATPITSFAGRAVSAMAAQDASTILVASEPTSSGPQFLVSVDLLTGADTVLGRLSSTDIATGFDFGTDGNLYEIDLSGNIYIVDPSNASSIFVGSTCADDVLDLAIATAVPEPSSVALLLVAGGIGLMCIRAGRSVPYSPPK